MYEARSRVMTESCPLEGIIIEVLYRNGDEVPR